MLWNATESKQILPQTTNNKTRDQQIELIKQRDPTVDYPGNNNRVIGSSTGINYRVFHYIKVFFDKVGGM